MNIYFGISTIPGNMAFTYARLTKTMTIRASQRDEKEVLYLEPWFRKKSGFLKDLPKETLLDVIQHCDFVTRNKDDCIILQGERGHRFFIILRGSVSVMIKDQPDDLDLGDETLEPRQFDRTQLGNAVVQLHEGQTFGELALIHSDCVRTASIVTDERTDLVVISRDLYNRSVSKVIAREYAEKMKFIESAPLFQGWSPKIKRQLAVSFRREVYNFDSPLVRQGEPAKDLFFILRGEVKVMVDPEAHYQQFERFIQRCSKLLDEDEAQNASEKAYFPVRLLPQLQKYTRMNKASVISRGGNMESLAPPQLPQSWSPSAIRKMNSEMHAKRVNLNLCYLGELQSIGDVELLLGLDCYHVSGICSQETTVLILHKNHFERLFRKKTQSTIREMIKNVEMQLTMRCLKHNILQSAPLMRCLLYKVQELNGERRQGDEKTFVKTLRAMSTEFEGTNQLSRTNTYLEARIANASRGSSRPALFSENTNNSCSSVHGSDTSSERNYAKPAHIHRSKTLVIPKVEC